MRDSIFEEEEEEIKEISKTLEENEEEKISVAGRRELLVEWTLQCVIIIFWQRKK